jgi:hypothetical protein
MGLPRPAWLKTRHFVPEQAGARAFALALILQSYPP